MTSTVLASAIAAYFSAANARDAGAAAACFTAGAVVLDEGGTHQGLPAIRDWVEASGNKYSPQTSVTAVHASLGVIVVTALVSGNFPGSPVSLQYSFTLAGEAIARLQITA